MKRAAFHALATAIKHQRYADHMFTETISVKANRYRYSSQYQNGSGQRWRIAMSLGRSDTATFMQAATGPDWVKAKQIDRDLPDFMISNKINRMGANQFQTKKFRVFYDLTPLFTQIYPQK